MVYLLEEDDDNNDEEGLGNASMGFLWSSSVARSFKDIGT